uniref:IclR family transcriptional regulator domain-containing protein n=1 Tax=Salinigranum rubrum TaxID=755307 RepID=UPI002AA2AFB7|nr:IclR family transcriptional regulator C-terminal domain-containing protein [Salinigranum rubrum]
MIPESANASTSTPRRPGRQFWLHSPRTSGGNHRRTWLPELTPHTITDHDEFFSQLDTIRERGYAFNDEESIQGLRAVGVPIRGKEHEILGALSVSGPTHRLKGDWYTEDIPDLLLGVSNELELNIRHA